MKRVLLTMAAVMVMAAAANAQLRLGIKAGLNFSNLSNVSINTSSATGFHGGVFIGAKFSKVAIEPAILFSTQGTEFEDVANSFQGKLRNDYVNIPLLVKFYLIGGLYLQGGAQVGFLTRGELEDSVTGETEDIKENLSSADWAIPLGVGFDLPLGLGVDLRYNIGVSNVLDGLDPSEIGTNSVNQKNQVFQLSAYWRILGK